jgi:hypothetical protein
VKPFAAITVIFCSEPHTEGVEKTKNVRNILDATDALSGIPESSEAAADISLFDDRRNGSSCCEW